MTGAFLALSMLVGLAACGGDSDDASDTVAPAEGGGSGSGEQRAEPEDSGDGPTGSSSNSTSELLGTVVVEGVEYEITELRNCDPLNDGAIERELELQGIGESEGERVQIDVYVQQIGGAPSNDVSWSGPEGVFGNPTEAQVEVSADGSFVTGSATVVDALTQTDTIGLGFNLAVPEDTIACR